MKSQFYQWTKLIAFFILSACLQNSLQAKTDIEKVSIEDLLMQNYKLDTTAGAVFLFDIGKTDLDFFNTAFMVKYTRHARIKIFNETEFDWAELSIPYYYEKIGNKEDVKFKKLIVYNLVDNEIVKTSVSKSSIIDEPTSDYYRQYKVAFPEVRSGTVIEFEYEITSPFKTIPREWTFQHGIPVIYSEQQAEFASFYHYKTLLKGYEKPKIDTSYFISAVNTITFTNQTNKANEYQYGKGVAKVVFEDLPAFYYEPSMKCKEDYISKLEFQLTKIDIPDLKETNVVKTWDDFTNELTEEYNLNKTVNIPDELAIQLETSSSDDQKVKSIITYIQDNFAYNNDESYKPSHSLREFEKIKIGNSADINLYFIQLCKATGIMAYPVILSTTSHGRLNHERPFLKQFNYLIALVVDSKGAFYCDPTLKAAPYYIIPEKCLNGYGFLVDKEQGQFVELTDISNTRSDYSITGQLNHGKDTLNVNVVLVSSGYQAIKLRNYILDKQFNKVIEEVIPDYDNIKLDSVADSELHDFEKPLRLTLSYNIPIDKMENSFYFNPFLVEKIDNNPFSAYERKYPIDYRYKNYKRIVFSMILPKGIQIKSMPTAASYNLPSNALKYAFQSMNNGISLQMISEFAILNPKVEADEYTSLRVFYNNILMKQNESIVFE